MSINLTRAQRRQMQKLADRVDRVTQADRRFFERFPHRQHRVRIASQAEIEQFGIIGGIDNATRFDRLMYRMAAIYGAREQPSDLGLSVEERHPIRQHPQERRCESE